MDAAPAFHVLVKPTGARCNLDCRYCFYLDKEKLYPGSTFRMSDETADLYTDRLLSACADLDEVPLAWQGGEPTLMGLGFFRRITERIEAGLRPGQRLVHTFQTNGTLLDEAWCRWLAENRVLVGLSVDGPRAMHDAFRRDKADRPTFDAVVRAARLLTAAGVEFNALTTVHAANQDHPLEVYRFLRDDLGVRYIQLIPIVEREGEGVSARTVSPAAWGRFLLAIFDEWVRRDVGAVFVPIFDSALSAWLGLESPMCVFRETCGGSLALEHTGDLYSCDHFVRPEHRLGNLRDLSLQEMAASEAQRAFGEAKRALPEKCRACPVLFACRGECPKNRFTGEAGDLNWLCEGYLAFFSGVDRPMRWMAELLRAGRPADLVMGLMAGGDPRGPCPCGSGRKYRRCHGTTS